MKKHFGNIQNAFGVAVKGAILHVKRGDALVQIFKDNGVTKIDNPLQTDENGYYEFYTANGRFDIHVSGNVVKDYVIEDVDLFDPDDSPLGQVPVYNEDEDQLRFPDGRVVPLRDASFTKRTDNIESAGSMFLSGKNAALNPSSFAVVYGNGQTIIRSAIDSTHQSGIPNLLERVTNDSTLVGSTASALPNDLRSYWRLMVKKDHLVTHNRPRSQIVSNPLKFRTHYRFHVIFRPSLFVPDFGTRQVKSPYSALFVLSQQGGASPLEYSPGQLQSAGSPLYIIQRGHTLYLELRTVCEALGYGPEDGSSSNYIKYDMGDTPRTALRSSPQVNTTGGYFHEMIIEFYLDERRLKDGGKGYFRGWFDSEEWFNHPGATSAPRNTHGNRIPIQARFGMYEINGGILNATDLCQVVNSMSIDRGLDITYMHLGEAG